MERAWRDIRKDTIEYFRQIFQYLEENGLLDMENAIDRVCLFLVFQPRIQASLDATREAWNLHKMRTERYKTPLAMYKLSRTKAIRLGYWTGDPGDDISLAFDPSYGVDDAAPQPPADELRDDPQSTNHECFADDSAQLAAGIFVNHCEEIEELRGALGEFDVLEDDGQYGILTYCKAVLLATTYFSREST